MSSAGVIVSLLAAWSLLKVWSLLAATSTAPMLLDGAQNRYRPTEEIREVQNARSGRSLGASQSIMNLGPHINVSCIKLYE